MDDMTIISKLQKSLAERLQNIGDSILAGGVDNMEKYRYAVGQAHAIQLTLQEISNLLDNLRSKKMKHGNVINIGNTKDRSTQKLI